MEMVEVKTAELSGFPLRYAVAVAEGMKEELCWIIRPGGSVKNIWVDDHGAYWPDELWEVGGPLIEKHRVSIMVEIDDLAMVSAWVGRNATPRTGTTPLIAACRAIVSAKLGDTVSVPKELLS